MKKLNEVIVAEIGKMKQILCAGAKLPKKTEKFIGEILSGMIAQRTVLLSQTARYLAETIDLIQTEKRLSYQLNHADWNVLEIAQNYLTWAKQFLSSQSILAFDLGDTSKEYARSLPRLGKVWDGSKKKVSNGWWMIKLVASTGKKQILPLFNYLFHGKSRRYLSHNNQVQWVLEFVVKILGPIGIWTFDRGFDDQKHFAFCTALKLKWIVRINSGRHLIPLHAPGLKKLSVRQIAKLMRKPLSPIAFVPVQLPDSDLVFTLLIRYYSKRPLYFLTNLKVAHLEDASFVLRCYRQRWKVEDSDRAIKQIFDLENIRSRTWKALNRLVHLSTWAHAILFCLSLLPSKFLHPLLSLVKQFQQPKHILSYRLAQAVSFLLLVSLLEKPIFR